jgi:hypothetical protein
MDPLAGRKKMTVQVDVNFLPEAELWAGLVTKSRITQIKSTDNGTRAYFNGYVFVVSPKDKTRLPHNVWLVHLPQNNCEECRTERWLAGGDADVPAGSFVRLRLEIDGLTFKGYVNDRLVLSHTDSRNYAENQTMVGLVGKRNKDEDPAHAEYTAEDYARLQRSGALQGEYYVFADNHDYLFDNFVVTDGPPVSLPPP